ncbi:MAG: FliM/FliN family flagellar motor C-terminal domain-containing protein [Planctomycetota bacterium]
MATTTDTILELKVPLIVSIASRSATVEEILSLGPGTILEMGKHADEELDVLVNNKPIGTGLPVKVGENFGIRISAVGSTRERAEALREAPEITKLKLNSE